MHHPPPPPTGTSQAVPNDSVIVIAPHYCTPNRVDFHMPRKLSTSRKYYKRYRILVDAAGVPLVSLKKRWNVYRGDSENSKDLLFSVKKTTFLGFLAFKTNLDVFLASNRNEGVCDFKIKQKCNEKSCFIYRGNSDNLIATMHKKKTVQGKYFGKDTFLVTVYPNVDYALVMALCVVVDEINHGGEDIDNKDGANDWVGWGGCGG
ncbi:hypothetical protein C5167_024926 [Papaver somniferum]|uniref:Tubby C-terminal domain-containing protein n=1 Tax=Papaver somniferum TaxID=3469 RepID=A0A4Y7JSW9_PAPSO|nr:hypothetical protein C5167_024926 [Papaver somniferum]